MFSRSNMDFPFIEQTFSNINTVNTDILSRKKRKYDQSQPTIFDVELSNAMDMNPFNNVHSARITNASATHPHHSHTNPEYPDDPMHVNYLPILRENAYGAEPVSYIYNAVCDPTLNEYANEPLVAGAAAEYPHVNNNIYRDQRGRFVLGPQQPPPEGRPILNTSLVKLATHNQFGKGRSPLTTVVSNILLKNPSANTTDPLHIKKQPQPILASTANDFFLYKENTASQSEDDYFAKLSDEIILAIFKYLPKKALNRCSYVCRRFSNVVQDETLWTRMDLASRNIQAGAMGYLLSRGVIILRLAQTKIAEPLFEPAELYTDFYSKLQYLDLSMAAVSTTALKSLLSRCRQLKKVSLEHVPINLDVCRELAFNKNLEALNLTMCEGIDADCIRVMMIALVNLHALNISWTSLDNACVRAFVENAPNNLLRLNIAGCRKSMTDLYLSMIVKRCPLLIELDLSDCTQLTPEAMRTFEELTKLEYLSLSRCYNITASSYESIGAIPSLAFLDVFGSLSEIAINTYRRLFPSISINQFIHSAVARPTVGSRRTSIWGLRTRD